MVFKNKSLKKMVNLGSNSIVGDRVTKKQKSLFKRAKKQPGLLFGDWDGDGVINGLDCQPRNKKRHGIKTKIGNFIKGRGFREDRESDYLSAGQTTGQWQANQNRLKRNSERQVARKNYPLATPYPEQFEEE